MRNTTECRDLGADTVLNVRKQNQLVFGIAEKELGISPIVTGKERAWGGGSPPSCPW